MAFMFWLTTALLLFLSVGVSPSNAFQLVSSNTVCSLGRKLTVGYVVSAESELSESSYDISTCKPSFKNYYCNHKHTVWNKQRCTFRRISNNDDTNELQKQLNRVNSIMGNNVDSYHPRDHQNRAQILLLNPFFQSGYRNQYRILCRVDNPYTRGPTRYRTFGLRMIERSANGGNKIINTMPITPGLLCRTRKVHRVKRLY